MIAHEMLLDLIDQVYEAATNPTDWPRFLESLSTALGGEAGVTLEHRSEPADSLGREELDLLRRLRPHLKRAHQIHERLGDSARNTARLRATLDALTCGIILVDARGRVIEANRMAREIAARKEGLVLRRAEIRASRPHDTRALQRCLSEALAGTGDPGVGSGGAVAIGREPSQRLLEFLVCPLRLEHGGARPAMAAAILVSDPNRHQVVAAKRLRRLYGLTEREAQVAEAFSQGQRLPEIAQRLGIRVNTVKARLREVYAKTGTHRQADLARLLGTHASPVRPDR